MYRLKLIAGLSYAVMTADGIVKATKDSPIIDVDDDTAQTLLSGDNFLVISAESEAFLEGNGEGEVLPELSDTERECKPPYGGKTLEEMNITEIEAFAAYKKVPLKGIRKKDAMINKLREVLPEEETTGVLEYGSPTMVELQDEK